MNTTVKELKAYYVERGGSAATVANITTIPDMIAAITKLEETSPSVELPKVTSTDNGDVLTVVSGKWAKAAPSGGGGSEPLIINQTDTGSSYDLNKTWKQIKDAFAGGTACVVTWVDSGTTWNALIVGYSENSESSEYIIKRIMVDGMGYMGYTATSETDYPSYVYD